MWVEKRKLIKMNFFFDKWLHTIQTDKQRKFQVVEMGGSLRAEVCSCGKFEVVEACPAKNQNLLNRVP